MAWEKPGSVLSFLKSEDCLGGSQTSSSLQGVEAKNKPEVGQVCQVLGHTQMLSPELGKFGFL